MHTFRIYEISLKVQVGSGTRFSGKHFIYFFLVCVCVFFFSLACLTESFSLRHG